MSAKVLERQRVKIVSLVNSKLTFAHHLPLQEAASLGPNRSQQRNRRSFCEMQDDYTLPLYTL